MKNNHKKFSPFLAGMLTMALITALTGTVLAASSTISYGQAGISLFGEVKIQAGDPYTAPNGQQVPSVITYTDEAGGKTNYLSVRQLSELLDADIAWNSATGNVDIAPAGSGDITVIQAKDPREIAAVPVYGTTAGPFTEIDPSTVDTSGSALTQMANTRMISSTGCSAAGTFRAKGGNYIVYTVTNNGTMEQTVRVSRPITISNRGGECFTEVKLGPGQTLTRAFFLENDASLLQSTLDFQVDSAVPGGSSDVTMSLRQYS